MAIEVPVIETERLRLRGHRAADLVECTAMWGEPEVIRHTTARVLTEEETWTRLLRYTGLWQLLGYGYWAVEEKATGAYIGDMGFADFHREIAPSVAGFPEMGWMLRTSAHGKGYATEMVRGALAWADRTLPERRTVCIIHVENAASLRLAAKCGFREYCRTTYKESPVALFERTR